MSLTLLQRRSTVTAMPVMPGPRALGSDGRHRADRLPSMVLLGVCLVHAGAAGALLSVRPEPAVVPPAVKTVVARLVMATPDEPAPVVTPPPPLAKAPVPEVPKRRAKKQPTPKPTPAPIAAPVPLPEPVAVAAPAAVPRPAPPAPAASASEPLVEAPRFDAAYLNNPAPSYPDGARRRGREGKVMLRVEVDPQGRPALVEIFDSSGVRELDSAARAAVRRWRFVPAHQGGRAVRASVLVPVSFRLRQ